MKLEVRSQKLGVRSLLDRAPQTSTTNTQRSVIGRGCLVRDRKHPDAERVFFGATVIDAVAGENRTKRVRLQTGEHAGEVLMPGEYDIMEFTD